MDMRRQIQELCDLSRRQEHALFGALFLIGLLAAYAWVVSPHVAFLQASQQYERATHERLDASETMNDDLLFQGRKLQELCAERAVFSDIAFSPSEAKGFHSDLQAWCRDAALQVISLGYGNDENLATYGARQATSAMVLRSATMTAHGTYDSVVAVLGVLQSQRQKIWIDGFQMVTLTSKPGWLACDMTITICVDHDKESE